MKTTSRLRDVVPAEGQATMWTTLLLLYWLVGSLIAGSLILATVLSGRLSLERPDEQLGDLQESQQKRKREMDQDTAQRGHSRKRASAPVPAE